MDELLEPSVCYTSPLAHRLWAWFSFGLTMLLLGVVIPVAIWGIVGYSAVWQNPPMWWHGVSALMMIGAVALVARQQRESLRRRIKLTPEHFWIGGRWFGKRVQYSDVRLVELDEPEHTIGKCTKIKIQLKDNAKSSIWLKDVIARECFDVLRQFCDRAATMSMDGELSLPEDESARHEAQLTLAKTCRRRSIGLAVVGAFLAIWWGGVLVMVISAGASNASPRAYVFLVVMPFAIIGSGNGAWRYWRAARMFSFAAENPGAVELEQT